METKSINKKSIAIIAAVVALIAILILAFVIVRNYQQKTMESKDISSVFGFSFDMDKDEIIEYEAETYGNTEYDFNSDNNRLAFGNYELNDTAECVHYYFFDDNNTLDSVSYSVKSKMMGTYQCQHLVEIKKALLKTVGNWDKTTDISTIVFGQIDGVTVKVTFYSDDTMGVSKIQ